jgi:hypothetical protein
VGVFQLIYEWLLLPKMLFFPPAQYHSRCLEKLNTSHSLYVGVCLQQAANSSSEL